ncbi:bifunctional UDP-N-acetylglucosamine diphosphorylase/glucosamine-1-phosphate N-acetyltransferase GlmU [Hirschia baltica]|uniref:Bifunctional protein GlmU n=1 Tax=Hirschia baltica (strain ATCC 49814 / DSM 5838 / IFAM 1418) TaxID=582402 RepID=C6XK93_HIRBI|nr:bifunctional UDP-N-acetylglucosamine diphosphorylase/glucosamine-1-phosphate N-acetyltransferase GlmU [Hirschia baltica]ACT59538.1 UDP-N-acetylglucosamine pyrophosphorylase [Hirschia baltica ATCC 49814]
MSRAAIILAAGKGTRMKSATPKVLHKVGGRAMMAWTADLATKLGCEKTIIVVGPQFEDVHQAAVTLVGAENVCVQETQSGTATAVQAASSALKGFEGEAIVLYADTPLIPEEVVLGAFTSIEEGASISVLGFEADDPGGYGRLILGEDGGLDRIVEAKDASPEEYAVRLCNSGVMAAPWPLMEELLGEVKNDNAKGEYYLTDLVGLARKRSLKAAAVSCREDDVLGVNSRVQLAEAEAVFQQRARIRFMEEGVGMIDPNTVYFSWDTQIGNDVFVEPNVVFGPGVSIASNVTIKAFCHFEGASVSEGAVLGPYARLRPGASIGEDVRVGNFVEVKNTTMEKGSKANHLAYLGDGVVGENANIGAGTIFCNYDGYFKHRTEVGKDAFVGSNSSLVAPVKIGDGAMVGSGSVVTKNVNAGDLALARGQQITKTGWSAKFREVMSARKKKQ